MSQYIEENKAFQVKFTKALNTVAKADSSLVSIINELSEKGIEDETMLEWGIEAGYAESYIRTKLSNARTARGERKREKGAGRKANPEAERIFAFALSIAGGDIEKAGKLCRNAATVAKKATSEGTLPEVAKGDSIADKVANFKA